MSDYLWDKAGTPDPEIAALEQTLAALRYQAPAAGTAPAILDQQQVPAHPVFQLHQGGRWKPVVRRALAAGAALAAAALLAAVLWPRPNSGWTIAGGDAAPTAIAAGELLTAPRQLQLNADGIGTLTVEAGSRIRPGRGHQFELQRGVVHAFIWAPPGQFVIDTPRARVVDLGCQYTLSLDDAGNGLLTVETGWVAFQAGERESFIPAGAACQVDARRGPGTPYRPASADLARALLRLDAGDTGALAAVLDTARAADGVTLWHLLVRATPAERTAIFDRLAQLIPLPPVRAEIIRGEPSARDAVWNALQLGHTDWWRTWKHPWPNAQAPSGALQ
ncbi:MAG: hypothetical protein NTZ56_04625 [Acidobacteria bacterium]|nr:hypothetical protein [Acidobacteriota bacterium]